jgi:predicted dehydrogenase
MGEHAMQRITRREMVKSTVAGGLFLGLQDSTLHGSRRARAEGPNSEVRLAVIGLGGIDIEGSVGGRGRQLLRQIRKVPGVKVVAMCDVDEAVLGNGLELLKDQGQVAAHRDLRRVFDDKNIDAVVVALPNHWHALATIWACQAGKDVYVEKPFSHSIWEGRQMVAAARKHERMVQTGTQSRSSANLADAFQYIKSGELGKIQCVHALVYRARGGIARVEKPTPVPSTVDYNLWCGPTAMAPVMRKNLHYEWHWFWPTGNGEIGNNGPHTIDIARWALGQNDLPPRALSIGGRFGVDDAAETANTQIAIFDYQPAPLICEVRNLRQEGKEIGTFRGTGRGVVVDCEGGYYIGDSSGGTVFDKQGKKMKEIRKPGGNEEFLHMQNFVDAVRSRKSSELVAEAEIGHVSAACCHMANLSHRLGKTDSPAAIRERISANAELAEALDRCGEYLRANGVDLNKTPAVLGPWVTWDSAGQKFVGELGEAANQLDQGQYRKPFEVPKLV